MGRFAADDAEPQLPDGVLIDDSSGTLAIDSYLDSDVVVWRRE